MQQKVESKKERNWCHGVHTKTDKGMQSAKQRWLKGTTDISERVKSEVGK